VGLVFDDQNSHAMRSRNVAPPSGEGAGRRFARGGSRTTVVPRPSPLALREHGLVLRTLRAMKGQAVPSHGGERWYTVKTLKDAL
jgi:hypothetical protein